MTGEHAYTFKILRFDPLQIELPETEDGTVCGRIAIRLPAHHMKLLDLSMGGILPDDPHVGGDVDMYQVTMFADEPVPVSSIVEAVTEAKDLFKQMHDEIQRQLDERGPLLGPDRRRKR